jgi:hypothetical protein
MHILKDRTIGIKDFDTMLCDWRTYCNKQENTYVPD